jgi:glycerol-3-phosphate acyltransferase PlsY
MSLVDWAPGAAAGIGRSWTNGITFAGVPGVAWTAGVLAILTVLVGATLRMGSRADLKTVPKDQ